ncbi:chemotaxis protein CheA [Desulfobacter vibrioformis]|uniref:chemotaxis protein CheA n=1 Tax=Desulfobacter vibrioformis TaxID=34031 RepID=UPI0005510E82|nr:chemotaxis protein CheA [Desulfobacter vibrioformis]
MDISADTFKEEACDLLEELETALLELEETPEDMDLVGRVFRAMHTIKGSGAMFGFDAASAFTHHVESAFDLVRDGKVAVSKPLINLTLTARDHISTLLDLDGPADDGLLAQGDALIKKLREMMPDAGENGTGQDASPLGEPNDARDIPAVVTFRIWFKPFAHLLSTGNNPRLLLDELRELGQCSVVAHTGDIPDLESLDPRSCYLLWDILLTTDKGENAIKDVFIFVEDDCELVLEPVYDDRKDEAEHKPPPSDVRAPLTEQEQIKQQLRQKKEKAAAASLRVPVDKLNQLVALVGELVTVQARLSRHAAGHKHPELVSIAEDVEMLSSDLRDNAMSLRMLEIGSTFSTFRRLVRDLSDEQGKAIELTTSGGETELDKTVIEQLKDPLVHIIRNSIDHGIEAPGIRKEQGKPPAGSIHLSAEHSGANVLIRIKDDGRGIDPEIIREKAVQKELILPGDDLTPKQILQLVFAPGFSTAAQVTDLSGRGVGMDVVKRKIANLNGEVALESVKGKGTTLTLKLPLTLAIIDGLLVTLADNYFILPLSSVEECVELSMSEQNKNRKKNRQILNIRGDMVPYIRLRDEYGITRDEPELQQVVVMRVNGGRTGFVVDNVIGSHQTVIKNIGNAFRQARDISGATILGDGRVALILDVNKVLEV